MICIHAPAVDQSPGSSLELALLATRQWERRVVHVRFLEGGPALWARVAELMMGPLGWNSASALQFRFDQIVDAEVQVTFQRGASWSQMGTDATLFAAGVATMNLAISVEDGDDHIRRPVLHEFGHAMGFVHEQASPEAHIPWDLPAVYAYYRDQLGWSERQIEAQVLAVEDAGALAPGLRYDPESIMHYWVPAEFVTDRVARGGNSFLSAGDRAQAAAWYGPAPAAHRTFLPAIAKA